MKELSHYFPFKYVGGGYFRRKGIPKDIPAEILHGDEAVKYLFEAIKKETQQK